MLRTIFAVILLVLKIAATMISIFMVPFALELIYNRGSDLQIAGKMLGAFVLLGLFQIAIWCNGFVVKDIFSIKTAINIIALAIFFSLPFIPLLS